MEYRAGARVNDEIVLKRRLGAGAMGDVWVGDHRSFGREVAIKFVSARHHNADKNADQRFENEGRASARVRSPHVVQTYDFGRTEDGTPYLVMELLKGETLGDLLRRTPVIDPRLVADVVDQVARGLDGAHLRDIVHRDIKPDNIFLVSTGDAQRPFVKLLDFGTAHNLDAFVNHRLTQPGMILGTPAYISRDLVLDPSAVGPLVDLWAIGVVVYRALTGQLPFLGAGIAQVCSAIVSSEWVRPSKVRSHLPPGIDGFFERVFHEEPARRPGDAFEMASLLRRSLGLPAFQEVAPPALPEASAGARVLRSDPPPKIINLNLVPDMADPGTIDAFPTPALPREVRRRPKARRGWPWKAIGASAFVLAGLALAGTWWVLRRRGSTPTQHATSGSASAALPMPSATASTSSAPKSKDPVPLQNVEPEGKAIVAGGEIWLGCAPKRDISCEENELPRHLVKVASFAIDRTEVTVQQYANCVRAGVCADRNLRSETVEGKLVESAKCNWGTRGRRRHPVNCVSAMEAEAYCKFKQARLPSEAEWEWAARGTRSAVFPWGSQTPTCNLSIVNIGPAGCRPSSTVEVGSRPAGMSSFGVFDLAGNVSEWVSDGYRATYALPLEGADAKTRVVRGGSWRSSTAVTVRIVRRNQQPLPSRSASRGFRCSYPASPKPSPK